ncbi:hypothetical protein [Williamsia sterculiae]|nr:hypothetical protein [Williamsia sterculiae]
MGVGPVSERLADLLVPGFRARMSQFRLLTAIAVASAICEDVDPDLSADGRTTPQIAFEWMTLEAFANQAAADHPLRGVPGLQKARVTRGRGERLSANSYLKGPKVFGFHGVYKPLATEFGIIDTRFDAGPLRDELLVAWETDNDLEGFVSRQTGTYGQKVRERLTNALRKSLSNKHSELPPTGEVARCIAGTLHPDLAGPNERAVLRTALHAAYPLRSELAHLMADRADSALSEKDFVEWLLPQASPDLRHILQAIDAYEQFARILDVSFRTLCHVSGSMSPSVITPDGVSNQPNLVRAALELPSSHRDALRRLTELGIGVPELEGRFAPFATAMAPRDLVVVLLQHHQAIQTAKPPLGKRPWFEPYKGGVTIRPGYKERALPAYDGSYIHPVRIFALASFLWGLEP